MGKSKWTLKQECGNHERIALSLIADLIESTGRVQCIDFARKRGYKSAGTFGIAQMASARLVYLSKQGYVRKELDYTKQDSSGNYRFYYQLTELGIYRLFFHESRL